MSTKAQGTLAPLITAEDCRRWGACYDDDQLRNAAPDGVRLDDLLDVGRIFDLGEGKLVTVPDRIWLAAHAVAEQDPGLVARWAVGCVLTMPGRTAIRVWDSWASAYLENRLDERPEPAAWAARAAEAEAAAAEAAAEAAAARAAAEARAAAKAAAAAAAAEAEAEAAAAAWAAAAEEEAEEAEEEAEEEAARAAWEAWAARAAAEEAAEDLRWLEQLRNAVQEGPTLRCDRCGGGGGRVNKTGLCSVCSDLEAAGTAKLLRQLAEGI